jgi:transcriptional regulator GlxA family with amidase domain
MISTCEWEQLATVSNYDAKTLAELSRRSIRQLQRYFHWQYGKSPQKWLEERRLMNARNMLGTGCSVKQVAIDLGFKQSSHFCRKFKSYYNQTPSEFYRSNHPMNEHRTSV